MNTYNITHRIHTLLHNGGGNSGAISEFVIQGITFRQENFSVSDGWKGDYWLASGDIEATTGIDAINSFRKKLDPIVCALCLVGQAYTEYVTFSSLVTKPGYKEALFFYYNEENDGHNLMLMPEHVEGIEKVLSDKRDFSQFLKYWREITNTPDYIARLMLCCAAIDAMTKCLCDKADWEKEKHQLREKILGQKLKEKLFGTKSFSENAHRHTLIHGVIKTDIDEVNTVNEIRNKIIAFFNQQVFGRNIMSDTIVDPWRNPYKNFVGLGRVIRFKNSILPLGDLEKEFRESFTNRTMVKSFEYLSPDENNRLSREF